MRHQRCLVKDRKRRIVGYPIDTTATTELAATALPNAVTIRDIDPGLIVHSDRATQFRSRKFTTVIESNDLPASMGQVATSTDNAAMESFFSLLQKNVLNRRKTWATRHELRTEIVGRSVPVDLRPPTTADADNDASVNSPQSNTRPSTNPQQTLPNQT